MPNLTNELTYCANCGKEVTQTSRRVRLYCNDACRMALNRKTEQVNNEQINSEQPKTNNKRGKDIKCFADLPRDVQETINRMSRDNVGRIDEAEHKKRTAAAIKYQHLFPHKYDSPGPLTDAELVVVTGKPGDADYNGICTPEWRAERGR